MQMRIVIHAGVLISLCAGGCPSAMPVDPGPVQSACGATSARIGQRAALTTRLHSVSGTARIADDCTIVIENFTYDGGGLTVVVRSAGADGDFARGAALTGDIAREGGYANETLTVALPVGVSLDDISAISIYCEDVDLSFGDGVFR